MTLPKSLTTVTPFSRALALSMLVVFPILGFLLGVSYQSSMSFTGDCNVEHCQQSSRSMFQHYAVRGGVFMFVIVCLLIVGTILKGFALWKAGKNKQSGWFIALFVINSLGILPLIYLLYFKPNLKVKRSK